MEILELNELIKSILETHQVSLYESKWDNVDSNKVLQISIMKLDGSMDVETCQAVSESISEILDTTELSNSNYFLEVCSPGAERILRNKNEIMQVIGQYVFVKLKKAVATLDEITGNLVKYQDDVLVIEYRDKTRIKQIEIKEENIAKIRLAVKI